MIVNNPTPLFALRYLTLGYAKAAEGRRAHVRLRFYDIR